MPIIGQIASIFETIIIKNFGKSAEQQQTEQQTDPTLSNFGKPTDQQQTEQQQIDPTLPNNVSSNEEAGKIIPETKVQEFVGSALVQSELDEPDAEKSKATTIIQKFIRKNLARDNLDQLDIEKKTTESATKIQKFIRMNLAQNELTQLTDEKPIHIATTTIQKFIRRDLAQNELAQLIEDKPKHEAATTIQKFILRKLAQNNLVKLVAKHDPINKFKEKLRYMRFSDESAQQIAEKIFKVAPKDIELKIVIDCIFNECGRDSILPGLNAILATRPDFILSSYDQIRKQIVEDEKHLLTNDALNLLFEKYQDAADEEKMNGYHRLAYRLNHPHIYPVAQKSISTRDYSLNFLWVNLKPQDRSENTAKNIFKDGLNVAENADCLKDPDMLRKIMEKNEQPSEEWAKIKKTFTYKISRWADANPNAQINLWYDSALVTQQAQQKTFDMMQAISKSKGVDLKLRDIRQINLEGEIKNSLHPRAPVYFRVDLLKAVITDYMLDTNENGKYCVVSDIDIEPMSAQQIFDGRTVDFLDSKGYVFNRIGYGDFENSFFIFNKEHKDVKKIHRKAIIKKTKEDIKDYRQYPKNTNFRVEMGSQFVYNQYKHFREGMGEKSLCSGSRALKIPRKVVQCPSSQFNYGGNFSPSDHQEEKFRFIGDDNTPYTRLGRNFSKYQYSEAQIDDLKNWKAEPLEQI